MSDRIRSRRGARTPVDARSTGRKRGRKTLFNERRPYFCTDCGRGPTELPNDAPKDIDLAPLDKQVPGLEIQCDHENKDILDNDPSNLNWRCPSCHAIRDRKTAKGVALKDSFGYDNFD